MLLVWMTLGALALVADAGIGLGLWLRGTWLGAADPFDGYNVFYVLFSRNEPWGLGLVAAFAVLTALWLRRQVPVHPRSLKVRPGLVVVLLAVGTFVLAAVGNDLVFHRYALSADENMANFQARIFLSGHLRAVVPAFWEPMIHLIRPTHTSYFPELHSWNSSYLPVYAAMRALFMFLSLEDFLNPMLGAISVLTVAAVTKKIWPDDNWKPVIAAALLASSSQVLVMSMTAYAMPAHLAFNLIWLWLYLSPEKRRFWLTPFVGVAALALHQPFFHALFATPFLFRLVRERRWRASFFFAVVYVAGVIACVLWWHRFLPTFDHGAISVFAVHRYTWVIQFVYLLLLVGWLAFPVPLLAVLGFARLQREPAFLRDAALSCLLTFGFYIFVRSDQAHGWGDRYFHGTLGCLILVAVSGWDSLIQRIGKVNASALVLAGVTLALLVQFPLRCMQAEEFVRPYAIANEKFHTRDVDLVGFNPLLAYYGADLIRNDPFLRERPIVVSFFPMTTREAALLQSKFHARKIFSENDLASYGLFTSGRE
jgi:hypothetical protein